MPGSDSWGPPPSRAAQSWEPAIDAAPPVLAAGHDEPEPPPIVETTAPFRRPAYSGPLVLTEEQETAAAPRAERPPRTLDQLLAEDGLLTPEAAARLGLAVLDRLAAVHGVGGHHGDLRPGSILVGGDDQVRLADPSPAPGLSPYTAPEGGIGPAADLWSLGATLFTAVEGRPPAPGAPLTRAGVLAPVLFRLLSGSPRNDSRPTRCVWTCGRSQASRAVRERRLQGTVNARGASPGRAVSGDRGGALPCGSRTGTAVGRGRAWSRRLRKMRYIADGTVRGLPIVGRTTQNVERRGAGSAFGGI
ncbi:hypothetical protein ACFQGX_22885 [Nonomuraea dietziae]|uniref:hypothetical protein n=1 Tax=Nonomuraea dietziae TaxID=65515 RepID=UPI00362359AE